MQKALAARVAKQVAAGTTTAAKLTQTSAWSDIYSVELVLRFLVSAAPAPEGTDCTKVSS